MIVARQTLKHKGEILKMIGKKFRELIKNKQITEDQAEELQKDIDKNLVKAYSADRFFENLRKFFEKYEAFEKTQEKLHNINSEYFQKLGEECAEEIIDEDPEAWQEIIDDLPEVDETNFHAWMLKLPQKNRTNFLNKLICP